MEMTIDTPGVSRALNDLARHQAMHRILSDIAMDMMVCRIEGWDARDYIMTLKAEIDRIAERIA